MARDIIEKERSALQMCTNAITSEKLHSGKLTHFILDLPGIAVIIVWKYVRIQMHTCCTVLYAT